MHCKVSAKSKYIEWNDTTWIVTAIGVLESDYEDKQHVEVKLLVFLKCFYNNFLEE